MPDPDKTRSLLLVANLLGVLLALASLALIGRYAFLLFQAVNGNPRMVG